MDQLHPDIYKNILPLLPNSLDITSLDQEEHPIAYQWIAQLLNQGQMQLDIQPPLGLSAKLQHLFFTNRNYERTKGFPLLGFGYPILIWSDGTDKIAAPLFIWQIQVEPTPNLHSSWLFSHQKEHRVVPNRMLSAFFKTHCEADIATLLESVVRSGKINASALVACCNELSRLLGVENNNQSISIAACPDSARLENLYQTGLIHWAGIVGLYPPQTDLSSPVHLAIEKSEIKHQGHEFGLIALDSYQASAVQNIVQQNISLITGGSGTGKTHTLIYWLTNALSNGKRCLLVSENMGSLRHIQAMLAQLNLGAYHFLLRDGFVDKPILLDMLRAIANTETFPPDFDKTNYQTALDKCNRLKKRLEEQYASVKQNIFGPYNWTELVGRFLRSNRVEGKELLSSQLNNQDFKFDYEEYQALKNGIERTFPLYLKLNTLKHPLSTLHEALFTKKTKEDAFVLITRLLEAFLDKAGRLHHRYINKTNAYADRLTAYYENAYSDMYHQLSQLKDRIADASSRYGADFDNAGAGALRLYGVFSGKHKAALEARNEVAQAYLELQKYFEQGQSFDYQFTTTAEGKNIQKVKQNLKTFEQALQQWRGGLSALVQEELQRLNAKTIHEDLDFAEQIGELEYALDLLIEELNESKLFQQPFENKMLTIPKRQRYLEEIIEQLETIRLSLRDFDHFYDWQYNWLQLPTGATKVIKALVKVKPSDWMLAFESWYLNNSLTINSYAALPTDDQILEEYAAGFQLLKNIMPAQISQLWHTQREATLKKLKKDDRDAYNAVFGKKNQDLSKNKALQELLKQSMEAVTAIFPILLASPNALENDLPLRNDFFDYVLLDEAQYLPMSVMKKGAQLGKKIVIAGDLDQMELVPDSDQASSVLQWASQQKIAATKLRICHRWNPANLQQILDDTKLADQAANNFTLHFEQLDGRFDEENGTNEEEAQHIVRLLNEIQPTPKRTFPTVGIACFTTQQRDLIASYLLKIKQKWSVGTEKIQQLERNGLGIFQIEELRGQHFDVLIVATTFGMINTKGKVTDQLELMNTPKGISALFLLMSRALQTVFIVNSIPQTNLDAYLNHPWQKGTFLLANFLTYAKALCDADEKAQQQVVLRLKEVSKRKALDENDVVFAEEVAAALLPYLGERRIKTGSQEAQLFLPLRVQGIHDNQPDLAIQPDGFFANTPATNFVWEYEQQMVLNQRGLLYQPVWSVNWWKNYRQEARKLASIIIKMDENFGKG